MPINSVQKLVKTSLNGLSFPVVGSFTIPNAQVWIAPPVIGDMVTAPQIYVWGHKVVEDRKTMAGPRATTINTTSGFRDLTYDLDVYIKYMLPNDITEEDSVFPVIIDAVMQKLRGITIVQTLTDAYTGTQSELTEIGEHFDVLYGDIHEAEDQRYWIYEARITTTVKEKVQQ